MFLTKGDLYHSGTWKLWFEFAGGYLPMAPVKEACKDLKTLDKARKVCKGKTMSTGEAVLANQHLFNVYIHVGLNNQEFKGASCFILRNTLPQISIFTPDFGNVCVSSSFSRTLLLTQHATLSLGHQAIGSLHIAAPPLRMLLLYVTRKPPFWGPCILDQVPISFLMSFHVSLYG